MTIAPRPKATRTSPAMMPARRNGRGMAMCSLGRWDGLLISMRAGRIPFIGREPQDRCGLRSGLRMLVEAEDGLHVVGEAGTVDDAVRLAKAHRPAVLVLDLNMPGSTTASSLDALPALAADAPDTRVVILTMQENPE